METNDPALTKTPIGSHNALGEMIDRTSQHPHNQVDHQKDIVDKKGTATLQETVIGSNFINNLEDEMPVSQDMANRTTSETIAGENVTHEEPLRKAVVDEELAERDVLSNHQTDYNNDRAGGSAIVNDDVANMTEDHETLEENTRVNKGTETLDNDVIHSEHVNDGDNPARQPDRRDQQGSTAFDEGINEDTVGSEAPKSEGLTDMNRYANINNAQTRILNPDEKD